MRIARIVLNAALALIGVVSILATGGGGGGSTECSFFSSTCNPSFPPGPITPYVSLSPSYQTVQVGERATFTSTTNIGNPRYAWCRMGAGESTCTAMPQAVESSFTLASAALADDGARFKVTVTGNEGSYSSGFGTLAVSSMQAVTFEDGVFNEAEWITTTIVAGSGTPPTYDVSRYPTGGNPGYYRKVTYGAPSMGGSARTFMIRPQATYSPTSQGAIHHMDLLLDCNGLADATGVSVSLLVEQGDRKFAAGNVASKCWTVSMAFASVSAAGLDAAAFTVVDGPACVSGQACPDFSATAAPLRLGLTTGATWAPAHGGTTIQLDNWYVRVWRR